jgi:hypothetical protein
MPDYNKAWLYSVNDYGTWEELIEDAIKASIRDAGGILVGLTRVDDDGINTSSGAGFSSAAGRSQG